MVKAFVLSLILALPLSARAATVDFEEFTPPVTRYSIISGGLAFYNYYLENNIGTNLVGSDGSKAMSSFVGTPLYIWNKDITPSTRPLFDLISFDIGPGFATPAFDLTVNGRTFRVDGLTHVEVNLRGVWEVQLSTDILGGGMVIDNIVYEIPSVPLPASGLLILSALAMLRRRRG